jgi:4-diphosphocytidyl-2-C-methyl-D-erythritol kinase
LCDALEVLESSADSLRVYGISDRVSIRDNLVLRSLALLRERVQIPPVSMYLLKGIPTGAGMGGGSSDAAFTLITLNRMFNGKLTDEELAVFALKLGSDVPFFIHGKPVMASGRGELMKPVDLSLGGYHILVIKPDIHSSTADAYRQVTCTHASSGIEEILAKPPNNWRNVLANQFEGPLFKKFPILQEIKEEIYSMGALYASMSGSGSALYGIFQEEPPVPEKYSHLFWWRGKL